MNTYLSIFNIRMHINCGDNVVPRSYSPMKVPGIYIKATIGLLILSIFSGAFIGCGQGDSTQVIEDLVSEFPAVKMGESIQVECITADRYGNRLTYEWAATGGSILGTGSIVTWTAPDEYGTYSIVVTVTDYNGGGSSRELSINVTESG